MSEISVVSFNTRGIRNRVKRRSIFRHIRITYKNSVIVLQETHSRPEMERVWRSEWAGQIYFSHGSESGHSGVAILVPNGFQHPVREVFTDVSGRIVCVEIEVESHKVPLVGIYAPSVDDQTIKCDFIDQLRQIFFFLC